MHDVVSIEEWLEPSELCTVVHYIDHVTVRSRRQISIAIRSLSVPCAGRMRSRTEQHRVSAMSSAFPGFPISSPVG